MPGFQLGLLLILSVIAFGYDVWQMRIPNWLNITGAGIGLLYHIVQSGKGGFIFAVSGMAGMFVIALTMYLFKAIGGGDVKWFAALGAVCGFSFSLYVFVCAIFIAGFIAIIYIIREKGAVFQQQRQIPFMYAAFPGVLMTNFLIF